MTGAIKYFLSFLLLISALIFGYRDVSPGKLRAYLISISVRNIDSAAEWYHKFLGFEFGEKKEYPENKVTIGIMTKDDFNLELVQYKDSAPASKFIPGIANPAFIQGYSKIGYAVESLELLVKKMKADSVRFIMDLMENKASGTKMCIVLDNSGNWVQLMQKK